MDSPKAKRSHAETVVAIKEVARRLLAENGAASISLGAVARGMSMTTPALYRYFENRDALVTSLIVDACRELGSEVEDAVGAVAVDDLTERFYTALRTYRRWALEHAQEYVLIHGALYPGYRVPIAVVAEAALGALRSFVSILTDARAAGSLKVPEAYRHPQVGIQTALSAFSGALGLDSDDTVLVLLAYTTWLQLHGLVWQEVSDQMPTELFGDGVLFRAEMTLRAQQLGLA